MVCVSQSFRCQTEERKWAHISDRMHTRQAARSGCSGRVGNDWGVARRGNEQDGAHRGALQHSRTSASVPGGVGCTRSSRRMSRRLS